MEQDPAAAHGTGELQNIYNGLEEANSILERFRNRRSNAAAESAMREQQKERERERSRDNEVERGKGSSSSRRAASVEE